jgi:hypothetical protein
MTRTAGVMASLLAAGLVVACGSLQAEDPGLALRQGGAATGSLKTVVATVRVTKGSIGFQGFALVSATASIRLPSESDTIYKVKAQADVQIGFEVVIVDGHYYLKPPFLGFTELSATDAAAIPDLAKLFDPGSGLPAVIPMGRDPQYLGAEAIDGVDSHKIQATYTSDQVRGMLPQLASAGDVTAVIWVGGSDHLIRKAVLSGPFGDNGKDSSVEVDLSGFNRTVNISSTARTT